MARDDFVIGTSGRTASDGLLIKSVDIRVYTVPTEAPEADGTLQWDRTSLVVVQPLLDNGVRGLGYAVGDPATGTFARETLAGAVSGMDVRDTGKCWAAMVRRIRNFGRPGIASMAIAAMDIAIWDTKARSLGLPLHRLLGPFAMPCPCMEAVGSPATRNVSCARSCPAGWNGGYRGSR